MSAPTPYKAPKPQVYQTAEGTTVWLVERHALPMVSMALSIPTGSAEDPPGKGGLADITASMLDEGAGDRDAIEISTVINDLGASLNIGVDRDGSRVSLTVLQKYLSQAFEIFADVLARPRFEPAEYKRVSELWHNQLRRRNDSPQLVARVVSRAVMFGPDTPYGHPTGGQLDTAKSIELEHIKSFYADAWRPDRALLVVAGDITKPRLDELIAKHLAHWKKPAKPPGPRVAPPKPLDSRPRLVLVDRPEAPQAVISVVAPGVAAEDPNAPLLDLVNTALGGSFTSRLNQNLREDHGWTYGARSAFVETRGVGSYIARASVFTNVTAAALRETLGEIDRMAQHGLTADELTKVRARDVTELIETNETLNVLVGRLSSLGVLGLPYDFDAKASAARQASTGPQLAALAKRYLDTSKASIIVVGPRDQLLPQLRALDLGKAVMWTPEGYPAKSDEK